MTTEKGGRPRLPIGGYGNIPTPLQVGPSRYRARTRYRGLDGKTRTVARFGQTKTAARKALIDELVRLSGAEAMVEPHTPMAVLFDRWLAEVQDSARSAQTKAQYRYFIDGYLRERMGDLRVGEANTGRCDAVLQAIRAANGPSAARSCRAVLNGVFALARRQGAIGQNPVRDTSPISVERKPAHALTADEVDDLTDRLRSSERAIALDLADLVDMALATGCRVGELLAIRETSLDLDAGTLLIDATLVRPRGQGLQLQTHPKTAAGVRTLALPGYAVEMLRRRQGEIRFRAPEGVVFPSPTRSTLRDPTNCAGDLRDVLRTFTDDDQPLYRGVTFHTFRRTVATRLDDAGYSARQIADQLGHSAPSMTLDRYMGRGVALPDAGRILDR